MYATRQDMIDRFGELELIQLTDIGEVATGGIVDAVLDRAGADSDAEIDSYLAARYVLPLASVPPVLVGAGCDLRRYYLFRDAVPEIVETRYKARIAWLQKVAAGTASLGLDDNATPPPVSDGAVFAPSTRVFGRETERILGGGDD